MKPDDRFQGLPKHFWANVRTISQHLGYTVRKTGKIKVPTLQEITQALEELELNTKHVADKTGKPTEFGQLLIDYFGHRSEMELEELRDSSKIDIKHYLILDAHYTWWVKGRSYLCRVIDMLHMGYVDEVLFGRETIDRLPNLVEDWVQVAKKQRND